MVSRSIRFIAAACVFAVTGAAVASDAHWEYHGEHGPKHWGEMQSDFALCATGGVQSPIDIKGAKVADLQVIQFDYKDSPFKVVNNGHTVQVNFTEGSSISVDGKQYKLLQFHFHTPSEEAVNGKRHDMVAHFVHKSDDGKLAVIGVLLDGGYKANKAFGKVLSHLPTEAGEERSYSGMTINAADFMPASKGYYSFAGSLTTPPCSEGVKWMVLKEPVKVPAAGVKSFKAIYKMNARPLQALNGREILQSK